MSTIPSTTDDHEAWRESVLEDDAWKELEQMLDVLKTAQRQQQQNTEAGQ